MWRAVQQKLWSGMQNGQKNPDPSGRAALGIHTAAYEEAGDAENGNVVSGSKKVREGIVEKAAAVV